MKITQIKTYKLQVLFLLFYLSHSNIGICQSDSTKLHTPLLQKCSENLSIDVKTKYIESDNQPNIDQLYLFGSEYFKNKSYSKALPYLWKVFINDTSIYAKNAIRKIADSYYNLKNQDSVLYACYTGLKKYPDNQRLHYYAAYFHERCSNFECALYHYEALVTYDPDNINYIKKLKELHEKI
jgi:tetratricopeptide (TPR) repeat protein